MEPQRAGKRTISEREQAPHVGVVDDTTADGRMVASRKSCVVRCGILLGMDHRTGML